MVNVEMKRTQRVLPQASQYSRPVSLLKRSVVSSAIVALAGAWILAQPSGVHAQNKGAPAATPAASQPAAQPQQATGTKIGFVNTQRILQDSEPAKRAQAKIEAEFEKRNQELQKSVEELRKRAIAFEKDAPVMAESERNRRQRELGNMDADIQRKQREIQEDFNRRRNEEFSDIIDSANQAIKQIAESENYDLILQDAVTVSPRVDITEKVLDLLSKKKK